MNESSKKITTIIILLIIILAGIAVRFYKIDSPPADHQEWRQCDTASMARNFYRNGTSILYPQIDWGGKSEGYVESEFPLFPYAVSIIYHFTGIDFKFGRIFSVILYPFSALLIFLIAGLMYDNAVGIAASFIFSFSPLSVYYYRTFMPESLLLFFILLSFYFILLWRKKDKKYLFYLAIASFSLALLVKVLVLFLLPILLLIIIDAQKGKKEKIRDIVIFSIISLLPPLIWYIHAYSIYLETGITFGIFSGGFLKFGTAADWTRWAFYEKIIRRILFLILTPFGFILFLAGMPLKNNIRENRFIYLWIIFLPLIALSVSVGFNAHDYYLISFLPAFSIITAKAIIPLKDNIEKLKIKSLFALFIFSFSILSGSYFALAGNLYIEGGLYKINSDLLHMGRFIKMNTKSDELIAVAGTPDTTPLPVIFYLSDRRGWYMKKDDLKKISDIEELNNDGASVIATMESDEFPVIKRYKESRKTQNSDLLRKSKDVILLKLR